MFDVIHNWDFLGLFFYLEGDNSVRSSNGKLECFRPWKNLFWSTNSSLVPSWYIFFFHRQESCLQRENFCFWILRGLGRGLFRPSTYYSQTGGLWGSQRYDYLSSEWFSLTFCWEWIFPSAKYCSERERKYPFKTGRLISICQRNKWLCFYMANHLFL